MNLYIQGAVQALGYVEDGKYFREPDCYETIRDIIGYLRDDGDDYSARIECGRHNLIEHDMVPMIRGDDLSEDDFDIAVRLLVNLCQPSIASLKGKAPDDREKWKVYWELEENLQRSKCAFADAEFFVALKKRMDLYFIETEYENRDERLHLVVERIALLIKYILSINKDKSENRRTKIEDSSHDRVVMALIDSGIDKTLMHIANQPREREFHVTILDIFALILKEQSPEELAKADNDEISEAEKKKTEAEFRKINENHRVKETQKRNSFTRFGGSYVVKGMKGYSANTNQVVFKPIQNVSKITFNDERKSKKRVAKNRRPFEVDQKTHISTNEVRLKIQDMVIRLVQTCYNRLIKSSKQIVFQQGHVLHRTSQINYFFLVKFILRFARLTQLPIDRIVECTGVEAFHENNVQLMEYVENATTLKGVEAKAYGLKAQYALGAYNELVLLHRHAFENGSEDEKAMAQRALEHIVNVEEYRDLPVGIIKKFNPAIFSNNFLREVILTTHSYVRLVEKFVKTGFLKKVTKKVKVRKTKKSKATGIEDNRAEFDKMTMEKLEELWETSKEKLEKVVRKEIEEIEDMNPLSWQLEVDDQMQQQFAMLSIQRSLRAKGYQAAVGLYHASRKVWNSEGVFGNDDMTPKEEMEELKGICMADLKEVAKNLKVAEEEANKKLEEKNEGEDGNEMEEYDEEDEEETPSWKVEEIEFEFDAYLNKFANVDVLKWYVFLLNDFNRNSVELNQALVKMLHRIAFDLKMIARLFQVSLFQVFSKVNQHLSSLSKEMKKASPLFELYQFGWHVLKRFFNKAPEFDYRLGDEALFWKGPREAYEIEYGYGSWIKSKEADSRVWTEELETEVRNLYDEYRSTESDSGVDVLDFIEHNLSRARTRKQIAKKMLEFGMDLLGAKWKNDKSQELVLPVGEIEKIQKEWAESEEKDKVDLVDLIRQKMADDHGEISRKRVIKHLAHMGLNYEKPRKEKKLPTWDEALVMELSALKVQYDEVEDAENILGVDIVRYVMKRLSEKKPISQVERYLRSLGAEVPEREKKVRKKRVEKSKKDDFVNDDSETEEEKDVEEEEEGMEEKEDEEPVMKKKRKIVLDSDEEEDQEEKKEEDVVKEPEVVKEKEPEKLTLKARLLNKKRKFAQLMDDSDDDSEDDSQKEKETKNTADSDDNDDEDVSIFKRRYNDNLLTSGSVADVELRNSSEEPDDPFTVAIKYKRRIIMSDDEDD